MDGIGRALLLSPILNRGEKVLILVASVHCASLRRDRRSNICTGNDEGGEGKGGEGMNEPGEQN